MGQVLHECARTTEAMRKDMQNSKESIMKLAEKYSINTNTVIKIDITEVRTAEGEALTFLLL